jgi:hypothetical protein
MKTEAINTPSNWRDLKRHPLSAEYPDLPPEEGGNRMRAGLKEYGNIGDRRITLFEGMVLDGWQFLQACIYENLEPKFQVLVDGDPAAFVEIMNDTRRHENSETIRLRAEGRRKRVVAARQQGQSLRTIAKEERISESQVRSDLKAATAQGCAVAPQDGKVIGLDGRIRPAEQPKLIPEIAQMGLSPKFVPALEAIPRGKQLDFVQYVRDGMSVHNALKAVETQREPGDDTETEKAAKKAAKNNGKPFFDWKAFDMHYGYVARAADEIAKVYGKDEKQSMDFQVCEGHLRAFIAQFKRWQERLTGTGPHSVADLKDAAGTLVPAHVVPAFLLADEFVELGKMLDVIGKRVKELKEGPAGSLLLIEDIKQQLRSAKVGILPSRPTHICPMCNATLPSNEQCRCCRGRGWTAEYIFKLFTSEREAAKR